MDSFGISQIEEMQVIELKPLWGKMNFDKCVA